MVSISEICFQVVEAYLCESLPLILGLLGQFPPLLSDDFGDLRVGKARILGHYCGLIMLTVKNEGCHDQFLAFLFMITELGLTIARSGDLGIRLTQTELRDRLLLLLLLPGTRRRLDRAGRRRAIRMRRAFPDRHVFGGGSG